MNIIFKYLICVFLSVNTFVFCASSLIIESNKMSDFMQYLSNNTLIVLDIDNTLIEPVQSLGSDQWAWNRVKKLNVNGLSEQEALKKTSGEWCQVHAITKVRTLEDNTSVLIENLQNQNYSFIALTTRHPKYAEVTFRELNDVGIDFANTSMKIKNCELPEKNIKVKEGIIFISLENRKGDVLKEFLQKNEYYPKKIIFVDDKLEHVKDVAEACMQLDIDFVGIRYGGADAHVASFDPGIAEMQQFFMHNILSDEEAAILIKEIK